MSAYDFPRISRSFRPEPHFRDCVFWKCQRTLHSDHEVDTISFEVNFGSIDERCRNQSSTLINQLVAFSIILTIGVGNTNAETLSYTFSDTVGDLALVTVTGDIQSGGQCAGNNR